MRRHHPDLVEPAKRDEATRRVQEINVAYGLVRDPRRRAEYDRARRGTAAQWDAVAASAAAWARRWWQRNRASLARGAAQAGATARASALAGRRAAVGVVGRALWLLACALGLAAGWVFAVVGQRFAGAEGVAAPLGGTMAGLVLGNRYGWLWRLRLARLPLPARGARLETAVAVLAVAGGVWLDLRF